MATSIDKDALTLTHAIALSESDKPGQPNYGAVGKSGEKGAYQWMPGNYEAQAKEAGIDPTDFSPTAQDKVAYHHIKKLKDQGYQPHEIASMWNSGSPDNYENHKGVNSQGVSYDTPAYVNKVKQNYMSLIGKSPVSATSTPTTEVTSPTETPAPPMGGQEIKGSPLSKGIANFGIGVGTAIGKGGIDLGEAFFNVAQGIAKLGGSKTSYQPIIDQLENIKNEIYKKPFESNLKTGAGKAGTAVGFVAPLAEDIVGIGKAVYGKIASKVGAKSAEKIIATAPEDVAKLTPKEQKLWYKAQADVTTEKAADLTTKAKAAGEADLAETKKEIQSFNQTIGETSRDTAIKLKQPAQSLMKDASNQYLELTGEATEANPALANTSSIEELTSKIESKFEHSPEISESLKTDLGLNVVTKEGETTVSKEITNQEILDKAREIMAKVSRTSKAGGKVYTPQEYEAMKKYSFLMEHLGENGIDMTQANKFWKEWAPVRDRIVREIKPFEETNISKMPITSTLNTAKSTATTAKQVASKLDAQNFISELEKRLGLESGTIGKDIAEQMAGLEKSKFNKETIKKVTEETVKQIKADKIKALKKMSLKKYNDDLIARRRIIIKRVILGALGLTAAQQVLHRVPIVKDVIGAAL